MSDTTSSPDTDRDTDRYTVPALERGLRLMNCFSPTQPVWSAPDLARELELPRSTVFRMLTTLENMGYLQRSGTEYRLGLAVLRLGYDYLSSQPLANLAQPVMQALHEQLGFTCNLALLDGTSIVYVARVGHSSEFQSAVRVGSRLPAHATVLGRVLLQDMTAPQLRKLYGGNELPMFTPSTPRTVDDLLALIAQDVERGYAEGEGFYESGVSGIAAPVRGGEGKIVAGIGMVVPFAEVGRARSGHWVDQVVHATRELSGYLRAQHPMS
ncbi:MAG: IclR family transcriptional regulator [Burkholderiaceae bacterium]|jgi:DNA-binding IclR family transcriptional regulator|nr:IclR family transcriptional regulator [Burkholderiaceae bacterium]